MPLLFSRMTRLFQCWTFHAGPSVFLPGEGSRKQQDADTIALIISSPMYGLRTRVGALGVYCILDNHWLHLSIVGS